MSRDILIYLWKSCPRSILGLSHVQTSPASVQAAQLLACPAIQNSARVSAIQPEIYVRETHFITCKKIYSFLGPLPLAEFTRGEGREAKGSLRGGRLRRTLSCGRSSDRVGECSRWDGLHHRHRRCWVQAKKARCCGEIRTLSAAKLHWLPAAPLKPNTSSEYWN